MFGRFVYYPSGWIRKRCFGEKVAEIPCWAFIRKEKQNLLRHGVVLCVLRSVVCRTWYGRPVVGVKFFNS